MRSSIESQHSPPIPPNRQEWAKGNLSIDDDYNGYLSFMSLEPPTPSRLNPTFTFPRRGHVSESEVESPRLSIFPPLSRNKHQQNDLELQKNNRRSSAEDPPRPTLVKETRLIRHTVNS